MSTNRSDRTAEQLTGGALGLEHQAEYFGRVLDGVAPWGEPLPVRGPNPARTGHRQADRRRRAPASPRSH